MAFVKDDDCTSSEPFGGVCDGIKRGSGRSEFEVEAANA